jgi:tetratricopeptide (TPR) repeat protein
VCADDVSLHLELISLLDAHDAAGDYFDRLSERVVAPALSAMTRDADATASDVIETLRKRLAGSYRIERELGGGAMSRIFVAEDLRLKRSVVLKVLSSAMAPTANTGQFQREIELAAQLQHPNIVPLFAADFAEGTWYYTMPLVTGESLRDRLARDGALSVEDALRIWRDILDALAHAHASGIVHRDIKPGNILLSGRNALVTDFGIARALETAAPDTYTTTPGLAIGTPAYMAPEQATGERDTDERVDLYQAGLVMYEMLVGSMPFAAGSVRELLLARVIREPLPLLRPDAPQGLVDLVMRCLARAPAERPPSAEAVLAELDSAVTGQERSAPPLGSRVRRLGRAATYTMAAALVALAAFAAMRRPDAPFPTTARAGAPDIAAYESYLRGMDVALLRSDSGRRQGVAHFERAIAIDSMYAPAYGGLSRMYLQLWNAAPVEERRDWFVRAEEAALRGVELDDSDPGVLAALGWVRLVAGDYEGAEASLRRATALDPSIPRGHEGLARVYMMVGRRAEQLAEARLGVASDPFSHSAIRELALALATNGRCEEAIQVLRPLKTLSPPAAVAGVVSGQCYASMGMWPEAIAELSWAADGGATFAVAFLGHALAGAGRRDEAATVLSDLLSGRRDSHGSFGIATVYAGLGDYDQAFAWLDRAIDEDSMNQYIMHPVFADLHRDPRFDRVETRMGVRRP